MSSQFGKKYLCRPVFVLVISALISILWSTDEQLGESIISSRYFSPIVRSETILLRDGVLGYRLNSEDIIVNSEIVGKDSLSFRADEHYKMDYQNGTITFLEDFFTYLESERIELDIIEIEYAVIPENILREFSLFTSREFVDTLTVKSLTTSGIRFVFPETDLNISGSKTFGVSIGSDEDFNINQSLFLRIDGQLRPNLWIQAQLSDSQSPLTPEGDTRELSSLDQIFIRLYGDIPVQNANTQKPGEYEVAFGDLELSFTDTQFMNYWSRFEGVKAEWRGNSEFKGALALSKGKQSISEFRGMDGKQGPYYISLPQVGTYVQIIPGSEEVYLNGLMMSRGTDYRINYAEGSITFTSGHFIDSNSQIYVRFQYSDEEYRQYKYLTGNRAAVTDKFSAGFYMIVESDDSNNPIQGDLSAEDKRILKEAGDGTAWADGVIEVDMGEGEYIRRDDHYEYKGINQGNYIIHFSYVGSGKGSYEQYSPGKFRYVGDNEGDWTPMRRLPSPEHKANYDLSLQWRGDFWHIEGEALLSQYDSNTFSDLDSYNNTGYATHWQLRFIPEYDRLTTDIKVYYRFLSRYLTTFTDINDPEMLYGIFHDTEIDSVDINEFGTDLRLGQQGLWNSGIRYFRKSGNSDAEHDEQPDRSFINDNLLLNLFAFPKPYLPQLNYRYHYYDNRVEESRADESDDNTDIRATQHNHNFNVRQIVSRIRLAADVRQRIYKKEIDKYRDEHSDNDNGDENTSGSRFFSTRFDLGSHRTQSLAGNIFVVSDENEEYDRGWQKTRESVTFGGEGFLNAYEQRLRTSYSHRQVITYPDEIESYYDMAEISLNSSLLKRGLTTVSNYSLVNSEFFPKIRELVFVGRNAGIYDSTGVYAEDGEYDYVVIPGGESELSCEINADFNIYFTPRQFITLDTQNEPGLGIFMKKWLSRIQTESSIIISENSRSSDKWDVYLLKPSHIMNEETTIYGRSMIRHTLWIDLIPRQLLTKLMLQDDKTLDNRYNESINTDINVREVMFRLSRFLNTDFEFSYENREEKESRYNSDVNSDSYSLDVRNRIDNNLNLATMLRYTREEGDVQEGGSDYVIHSFSAAETVSWFFQRKYRFFSRFEYRYNKREGSQFLSFLPEKRAGNVFRWNARLNYQLNQYTTASLNYTGNKYPEQESVHTMIIEFRAEF